MFGNFNTACESGNAAYYCEPSVRSFQFFALQSKNTTGVIFVSVTFFIRNAGHIVIQNSPTSRVFHRHPAFLDPEQISFKGDSV